MSAYLFADDQPATSTPTGGSAVIAKMKKMPTSKLAPANCSTHGIAA